MAILGLVTVLYRSDGVLEDFFRSLSLQSFTDYHLFLIDNSSSSVTDDLISDLTKKYGISQYTHVKNDGNYGVATGNNQGIKLALEAGSDLVILLNNDIEFSQPFLLDDLVNCATKQNENLIIPKVLFYGTRLVQIAGGDFKNYMGTTSNFGFKYDADDPLVNKAQYFKYAPTCFMLISKKVFDKIGIMDEKYFVYYDDTDFSFRAAKAGFRVYYMPHLEVFHRTSFSTGGHASTFSTYQLNRNRIYYIRKNFSFPLKQVALSVAISTKTIVYLLSKRKDKKETILKAFIDGFKMKIIE